MTFRLLAILLAALCLPPALSAQSASSFDAVAPAMQAFIDKGEAAGVVTLLATRDDVLHLAATGSSDLARSRRLRTDDIFWIASMSKPITAVAIAILADAGKISFDDPIHRYLPEFRDVQVANSGQLVQPSHPMTLRDVLTQSWADPAKGLIWIVMFQRNGKGNPDNSDVRIAF
jgi:CubicO group peptidase (beta-lactamase class C family)